jgi:hypothetical protein
VNDGDSERYGVRDRGEREGGDRQMGRERGRERMSARATARETHRKRHRERGGERERTRQGERQNSSARGSPRGQQGPRARAWAHARTLVAGMGAFSIIWQSAAYVTVKRRPLASVSTPAVGRYCARAPVNDHPAELVKVPCPCMVSSCHAPS